METQLGEVIISSKELVKPSSSTPSGVLDLSAIDKLEVLRVYVRTLHVFKNGPPGVAQVIKKALADALVPYYPLAGRLKIGDDSNSSIEGIDCCGQGVWFVEASALKCSLKSLNYFDDDHNDPSSYTSLLPDHPPAVNSQGPADPLVLMQVTQYACGGFVMGLTFCHSICDGLGAARFLQAVGEIARGASSRPGGNIVEQLSVAPVWHRHFFQMKQQSKPPTNNQDLPPPPPVGLPNDDEKELQHGNIDIPLGDIIHLKQKFHDSTGHTCSAFDIVAALLWKNRTYASSDDDNKKSDMMKLVFFANCRGLVQPLLCPQGFYGNCFFPVTITESRETLAKSSLDDVVKLIQHAKTHFLPIEFQKWINCQLIGLQDPFAPPGMENEEEDFYNTLFISEWARLGFNEVDYGWGPPLHVIPLQGSPMMPVAIVGSMPRPSKGIRLMTWCVHKPHLQSFLNHMVSSKVTNSMKHH